MSFRECPDCRRSYKIGHSHFCLGDHAVSEDYRKLSKPKFVRFGDGWHRPDFIMDIKIKENKSVVIILKDRRTYSLSFFDREEAEAYVRDLIRRMGTEEVL